MHLAQEKKILNPEQLQAVEHKEGPMLVLAGAGSGKTKVATLRVAQMIENGVNPEHIVGVTFTNKAAQEMRNRVERYVGIDVLISTFHSLGVRILRESIQHLGYTNDFAIYDETDSERLLKETLRELGVSQDAKVKEIRAQLSWCKNNLKAPSQEDLHIYPIYERYHKKLKSCNAVDFDDLLYLPTTLFQQFSELLLAYQNRWQYILVDEYQDNNHALNLVISKLANHGSITVVGDEDQCIYSFRGASPHNFIDFEERGRFFREWVAAL